MVFEQQYAKKIQNNNKIFLKEQHHAQLVQINRKEK
jgi:hypothetical protein